MVNLEDYVVWNVEYERGWVRVTGDICLPVKGRVFRERAVYVLPLSKEEIAVVVAVKSKLRILKEFGRLLNYPPLFDIEADEEYDKYDQDE